MSAPSVQLMGTAASQPSAFVPPEYLPDYEHIVTEDDTPVDNIFSEKQQRVFAEPLGTSRQQWSAGRTFVTLVNVGLYFELGQPPLVPDFILSFDVRVHADLEKQHRCYFMWVLGKPPDCVAEIVSNLDGGEDTYKLVHYARIGVPYYIIFDPFSQLGGGVVRVFGLNQGQYEAISADWLPRIGLGLKLWQGQYEGVEATWLRWCDREGRLLPTGEEAKQRADTAEQRVDAEQERADAEKQRADSAEQRAEMLAARLRELGVEP